MSRVRSIREIYLTLIKEKINRYDNRYMSLAVFSKGNIIDQSNYVGTHGLPVKTPK